jgi:hypothetical protein
MRRCPEWTRADAPLPFRWLTLYRGGEAVARWDWVRPIVLAEGETLTLDCPGVSARDKSRIVLSLERK